MDSEQYVNRVCSALHRAWDREKQDVTRELRAHLEDHAELLRGYGYAPEEADRMAAEAMGDPEETARALDAQFSRFWGGAEVLGRVMAVVVLCALLFLGINKFLSASNIDVRYSRPYPEWSSGGYMEGYTYKNVDLRKYTGYDTLRIYAVAVNPEQGKANIYYSLYDPNPFWDAAVTPIRFHYVKSPNGDWVKIYDRLEPGGDYFEVLHPDGANGSYPDCRWKRVYSNCGTAGAYGEIQDIPVAPGQESITLRYDRFGAVTELTVPIDGEVWK